MITLKALILSPLQSPETGWLQFDLSVNFDFLICGYEINGVKLRNLFDKIAF